MNIQTPEALFLLLLLIPVVFLLIRAHDRGRRDLIRLAGEWQAPRLLPVYLLRSFFSGLALVLALVFLVLTLAGISWGVSPVEETSTGVDVALVVDVSRSMLAGDTAPNRLAKAAETARFLADNLPSARFSLTVFKGSALTLVPLTRDHAILGLYLDQLDSTVLSSKGSQMEDGLRLGLESLGVPSARQRLVLLLSDGENKEGNPLAVLPLARKLEASIVTVGFGTEAGGAVPDGQGGSLRDGFGQTVISRLNRSLLQALAVGRAGRSLVYSGQQTNSDLLQPLVVLANPAAQTGVSLVPVSRYRLFLLLALLSFGAFLVLRIVKWQKQL